MKKTESGMRRALVEGSSSNLHRHVVEVMKTEAQAFAERGYTEDKLKPKGDDGLADTEVAEVFSQQASPLSESESEMRIGKDWAHKRMKLMRDHVYAHLAEDLLADDDKLLITEDWADFLAEIADDNWLSSPPPGEFFGVNRHAAPADERAHRFSAVRRAVDLVWKWACKALQLILRAFHSQPRPRS